MKRMMFCIGIVIMFGFFAIIMVPPLINAEIDIKSVLAAEPNPCDCDPDGGVLFPCKLYIEINELFEFRCCDSEGATQNDDCDCDDECFSIYNPIPCDPAES